MAILEQSFGSIFDCSALSKMKEKTLPIQEDGNRRLVVNQ